MPTYPDIHHLMLLDAREPSPHMLTPPRGAGEDRGIQFIAVKTLILHLPTLVFLTL